MGSLLSGTLGLAMEPLLPPPPPQATQETKASGANQEGQSGVQHGGGSDGRSAWRRTLSAQAVEPHRGECSALAR